MMRSPDTRSISSRHRIMPASVAFGAACMLLALLLIASPAIAQKKLQSLVPAQGQATAAGQTTPASQTTAANVSGQQPAQNNSQPNGKPAFANQTQPTVPPIVEMRATNPPSGPRVQYKSVKMKTMQRTATRTVNRTVYTKQSVTKTVNGKPTTQTVNVPKTVTENVPYTYTVVVPETRLKSVSLDKVKFFDPQGNAVLAADVQKLLATFQSTLLRKGDATGKTTQPLDKRTAKNQPAPRLIAVTNEPELLAELNQKQPANSGYNSFRNAPGAVGARGGTAVGSNVRRPRSGVPVGSPATRNAPATVIRQQTRGVKLVPAPDTPVAIRVVPGSGKARVEFQSARLQTQTKLETRVVPRTVMRTETRTRTVAGKTQNYTVQVPTTVNQEQAFTVTETVPITITTTIADATKLRFFTLDGRPISTAERDRKLAKFQPTIVRKGDPSLAKTAALDSAQRKKLSSETLIAVTVEPALLAARTKAVPIAGVVRGNNSVTTTTVPANISTAGSPSAQMKVSLNGLTLIFESNGAETRHTVQVTKQIPQQQTYTEVVNGKTVTKQKTVIKAVPQNYTVQVPSIRKTSVPLAEVAIFENGTRLTDAALKRRLSAQKVNTAEVTFGDPKSSKLPSQIKRPSGKQNLIAVTKNRKLLAEVARQKAVVWPGNTNTATTMATPYTLSPIGQRAVREAATRNASYALSMVEAYQGQITRDEKRPGSPVVSVDLYQVLQSPVTDQVVETLAMLTELKTLRIGASHVTDQSLTTIGKLNKLEELQLSHTKVTDPGLEKLAALKNLRSLDLSYTQVSDVTLRTLAEHKELQRLRLAGTNITDDGLQALSSLKLSTLVLDQTSVSDDGLNAIAPLRSLKTLTLGGTKITDSGMQHIVKFQQLEALVLNDTPIGDNGLKFLLPEPDAAGSFEVSTLTNLRRLDLEHTKITTAGLKYLAALPKLESLVLKGTQVNDDATQILGKLKTLKMLSLTNTKMTEPAIEQLKQMLPDCEVSTEF